MISESIDINVTDDAVSYILGESRPKYTDENIGMITRAYEFARVHHTGQVRASGDPYLLHLVETAHILVSLRMDALTIAAGLLHDTIEDCSVTHAQLAEEFGTPLADLVEGVTKISSLHFGSRREQHVESLRKMILASSSSNWRTASTTSTRCVSSRSNGRKKLPATPWKFTPRSPTAWA